VSDTSGKAFYLTTPIYYVNDAPHIGHAYTTAAGDVLTRWHRQRGERVWFLTGVDEHGQKVMRTAEANGVAPQAWADRLVENAWLPVLETIDARNDDFIRTTETRHAERVQRFLTELKDRGEIYEGAYDGPYCVACEEFKLAGDLLDGEGEYAGQKVCPIHGRPVEQVSETNWFFRLSAYADKLLAHYEANPLGVQRGRLGPPRRAAGPLDLALHLRLGHPGAVGLHAGRLRLVRRVAELRHRGRAR
jgi:methionyl-tRNA synthetase